MRRRDGFVAMLPALLLAAFTAHAQPAVAPSAPPPPAPPSAGVEVNTAETPSLVETHKRWHAELDAFNAADREHPSPTGGVVFVGSSTIRRWPHLARDFAGAPVPAILNRGFGGSTLAECSVLVPELVWRYRPKHVVVYAGDNDLAQGVPPLQVLDSFARFATAVRAELPDTRITFVSIKPSPSRTRWLPQMREANNIVAAYLNTLGNADYVDVFTPMLGPDGRARPELFVADRLHMNDAGYALWQSLIAPRLLSSPPPRQTP